MKNRLAKKNADHFRDWDTIIEWHTDHRVALLDTMLEGGDFRVINRQFKVKFTKGGRKNRYFKRTRMVEYQQIAIG